MIRIRKILCPVDFFPASDAALSYAESMAKAYSARLRIVHVIPPASSLLSFAKDMGQVVKSAHKESEGRLLKMAETAKASGVNASFEVRFGEIDREILNVTEETKPNLIVAGTHGRRGFDHWLIGSVCERLVRRVAVPILTISHIRRAKVPKVRKILVGVDFSAGSVEAVAWAFSIAEKFNAGVTLVHVVEFAAGDVSSSYRAILLDGIHAEMKNLVPAASNSRRVTTRVEFGIPFQVILKLVKLEKASMVVLGMHGKQMLERALVGRTAERVIRASPCPVLAVPGAWRLTSHRGDAASIEGVQSDAGVTERRVAYLNLAIEHA